MAVETPYTTEARITRLVGSLGIDLRTDDAPGSGTEADMMQDAIDTGTGDLDIYLQRYGQTDIAANEWCIQNATWFAVRFLCMRRLNELPVSVEKECERREKILLLVAQGKLNPPRLPHSRRAVVVTNSVVDLRRGNNQLRVDRNRSTGVAKDYRRPTDPLSPDDR